MSRRSRDNYSPYSPRRVVVSNLNHGTIVFCLGEVSHDLSISPGDYKRVCGHYGSLSLILLAMG